MLLDIGRTDTVIQFVTVLLLFAFVVLITWFTTRWVARLQKGQMSSQGSNMEVLETMRIAPDKFLELVKLGNRYFILAVGKNEINSVCELKEEELNLSAPKPQKASFAELLDRFKNHQIEEDKD